MGRVHSCFLAISSADIIVLGATSIPWTLEEKTLDIFTKKVYLPIPDKKDRVELFKSILNLHVKPTSHNLKDEDFITLAEQTGG